MEPTLPSASDYESFAEEPLPTDKLERLTKLANTARDQARSVEELEEQLKVASRKLASLVEFEIPQLMDELGVPFLGLEDGSRVDVKEDIRASISADRRMAAVEWLDAHGLSGMVKRIFEIKFTREQEKEVRKFEADLRKRKNPLTVDRIYKVEPMTLKAWATRTLEAGGEIDLALFGIHRQRRAKITMSGAKKKVGKGGEDTDDF